VLNQTGPTGDSLQLDFDAERHDSPDVQDQLGLKLESRKMRVEMLVIGHIDRPSEN